MLLCPRTRARDTPILYQLSVYLKGKGCVTKRGENLRQLFQRLE